MTLLEIISLLLLLDFLLLYATHISHKYTISWEVVFAPLLALFVLWFAVFMYVVLGSWLSLFRLKVIATTSAILSLLRVA